MWSVRGRGAFSRFSAILSPIISTAVRYPKAIIPTYFIFQPELSLEPEDWLALVPEVIVVPEVPAVQAEVTTKHPVIWVVWTSHLKKYTPEVVGVVKM